MPSLGTFDSMIFYETVILLKKLNSAHSILFTHSQTLFLVLFLYKIAIFLLSSICEVHIPESPSSLF